jgi:hypothetical protein
MSERHYHWYGVSGSVRPDKGIRTPSHLEKHARRRKTFAKACQYYVSKPIPVRRDLVPSFDKKDPLTHIGLICVTLCRKRLE